MSHAPRTRSAAANPLKPLSESLPAALARAGLAERLAEEPAIAAVRRELGEELGPDVRALRVRNGVLELEVFSAALAHELEHFRGGEILARVRAAVPSTGIRRLRFRIATCAPPARTR